MTALKLTAIGTALGVVIPKDMLQRLKAGKGDTLYAVETSDAGYHLAPYVPEFAEKMRKADGIMRRYRDTRLALAE